LLCKALRGFFILKFWETLKQYKHMEKILKVCNYPQGKGYVPGLRIAGNYLKEINFSVNDHVIINYRKNRITIKKASRKLLVKRMAEKNPAVINLLELLNLSA
jgi:hypothetical protein